MSWNLYIDFKMLKHIRAIKQKDNNNNRYKIKKKERKYKRRKGTMHYLV